MSEFGERYNRPCLKDLLISGARTDLLLPGNPSELELGTITNECNRLMSLTLEDPQFQEKAAMLYVRPEGTLIIDAKESTSTKNSLGMVAFLHVFIKSYGSHLPRHLRQDKYLVGPIHTHGLFDHPQSASDILGLFRTVDNPYSYMMNGVITPKRRIFIFRGENTPQWDEEFAQSKVQTWSEAFISRVDRHLRPKMSYEEERDINKRASTALINQIAQKYDLQIYTGSPTESTIKKGLIE